MVMEMSKTYQYRKVMKPLLERKRRARINKCLDDLKDLMVECLQQEGEHVTRLEKADILELTVEHMRKLKQRGSLAIQSHHTNTTHVESFRSGYVHAADQISQVLLQQRQTDEIGGKIMKFLSSRLIEMQQQLLRSSAIAASSPSSAVLSSTQVPTININCYAEAMPENSTDSTLELYNFKKFTTIKDNDVIDVTTVDNCSASRDTESVISVDSCSSESVWRPW